MTCERGWRRAPGLVALAAALVLLTGCSGNGTDTLGEGLLRAFALLFLFGLILPALVVGLVVAIVIRARKGRR